MSGVLHRRSTGSVFASLPVCRVRWMLADTGRALPQWMLANLFGVVDLSRWRGWHRVRALSLDCSTCRVGLLSRRGVVVAVVAHNTARVF